jgi:predicted peptidase
VISIVLAATVAASPAIASGSVAVSKFPRGDGGEKATYRYRLVEPPAEAIADGKRVPLVVFLHGSGERGDDNAKQLVHFVGDAAKPEFQAKAPCFILAPQCPANETWASIDLKALQAGGTMAFVTEPTRSLRAVEAMIDEVLETRPVDRDRVYLTGLSMGGFGAFDLAARRSELFAAVVPVCGGGDSSTAGRMKGLPFLIAHGTDDPVVPVEQSRMMEVALRGAGATVTLKEYAGVGHDSWTPAYRFGEGGVLDWMFAQRRRAPP